MGFLDSIYTNKYNSLLKKIEELNKKNVRGYKTFKEYILSDEIMISYFKELKKLERKFPRMHVDSYETFENTLFEQLKRIYDKMLAEIYQTKNEKDRIIELQNFKNDINDSYGHGCDCIIEELLKDLEYKINNSDKFKVNTVKRDIMSEDPMMEEVITYIAQVGKVSASLLQRKFKFGYSRACRIIDILEENHCIGSQNGSKPREVFINKESLSNGITMSELKEMSEEEYDEHTIMKNREDKSIEDIMLEYGIQIEYGKKDLNLKLSSSLIVSSDSDSDRTNLINTLIKYMEPEKLKIVLVGYDQLAFNNYEWLPHLLFPIVWDIKKISSIIEIICREMDNRYDLLLEMVKNIDEYNKTSSMPYILIVVDEVSEMLNNRVIYDNLIKLLLNGARVGIKIIMFTKFSKKNINVGSIEDLISIYNKFNIENILEGKNEPIDDIECIDNEMTGFDFEKYAGELLNANGFDRIKVTQASGDYGVDIIAYKDDIKYAIQCKKYSSPVGIKAVQEVIGSKAMNDCHVAAVLTNNTYTKSAKELAEKNGVLLWDRYKLEQLIENYKDLK